MSTSLAIKVSHLTKVYKLYDKPIDRLKESLHPLKRKYHKDFYALNDVSFEIKKGETVGIIGKNGAGKSTLLKIITGVLTPTSGSVHVNGRIASLLELGAGFNPEYTGLENIYLQGTLMGYSREEMKIKIEGILLFADIGDFIYQPVKTYSSGMFARLAFAVAINVEPDILIVDEALSVGDALFQKRCFQKMEELVTNGVTLLFVSHDQESIRTLTNKAILLKFGKILAIGSSSEVVLAYRKELHDQETEHLKNAVKKLNEQKVKAVEIKTEKIEKSTENIPKRSDKLSFGDGDAEIVNVRVYNEKMEEWSIFYPLEKIIIIVDCKVLKKLTHLNVALRIRNKEGLKIYSWGTLNQDIEILANRSDGNVFWENFFEEGEQFSVRFEFESPFGTNLYEIQASISEEETPDYMNQTILHWKDEAAFFQGVVSMKEYFFGGAFDLKMKAELS